MKRSNAETYEIQELGVSRRAETWAINYTYAHLVREFCEARNYEPNYYRHHDATDPSAACAYKRSANLCYDYLQAQRLFDKDSPIHENLVAVAAQYAIEPQFSIKIKDESYPYKTRTTSYEAYQEVTSLKIREFFYVYLHPELYDIQISTRLVERCGNLSYGRRGRYGGSISVPRTTEEVRDLKLFPKDMVATLHTNLCHSKMADFLKNNLKISSRIFFDLDIKNLNNDRERFEDITRFSSTKDITIEELDKRIARATEAVSFFDKACEDLRNLRAKISASPALDYKEDSYQKALDFFKENAPLYVNDEDIETRHLCYLIMEGADTARIATEWQHGTYMKQFSKRA
jgi:hypothetical protein